RVDRIAVQLFHDGGRIHQVVNCFEKRNNVNFDFFPAPAAQPNHGVNFHHVQHALAIAYHVAVRAALTVSFLNGFDRIDGFQRVAGDLVIEKIRIQLTFNRTEQFNLFGLRQVGKIRRQQIIPRVFPVLMNDIQQYLMVYPAVLPDIQRGKMVTKQAHFADQVIKLVHKKGIVPLHDDIPNFHQFVEQLIGGQDRRVFLTEGNLVHFFLQFGDNLVHLMEGESSPEPVQVAVVTFQDRHPETVGHAEGSLRVHVRIAVAVASRPEAQVENIIDNHTFSVFRHVRADLLVNISNGFVKNIFQVPNQAHCLIVGGRLFFLEKRGLPQLLQQQVNCVQVVLLDCVRQVGDDPQYSTGIKLRRMRRQHQPHPEILHLVLKLVHPVFLLRFHKQIPEAAHAVQVIYIRKRGVFNRVKQHDLTLDKLDETEK